MLILIPVDVIDGNSSKITKIFNAKGWALIEFGQGLAESIKFFDDRSQIDAPFIDFVVLQNKFESYMDFMEEGSMVLVVREEETIEEIVEAFRFKELDEIGL